MTSTFTAFSSLGLTLSPHQIHDRKTCEKEILTFVSSTTFCNSLGHFSEAGAGAGDGPGAGDAGAGAGDGDGVGASLKMPLVHSGNLTEHLQSSFMFCSQSFKGNFFRG